LPGLAWQLGDVAACLERLAPDIAANVHGTEILARASRLIGVVERLVAQRMKTSVLH
jgi:hypothetical protein